MREDVECSGERPVTVCEAESFLVGKGRGVRGSSGRGKSEPKKLCSVRWKCNIGDPVVRRSIAKTWSSWAFARLSSVKQDNESAIQLSSDESQQEVISKS
jgi:hypothetical protein